MKTNTRSSGSEIEVASKPRKEFFGSAVSSLLGICLAASAAAQAPDTDPEPEEPAHVVQVNTLEDRIEVDNGALRFVLSLGAGATLRSVEWDGRRLVDGNEEPLLRAVLMESAGYDGITDTVADPVWIAADYRVSSVDVEHEAGRFQATLTGQLAFEGGDALRFRLSLAAPAGEPRLEMAVELAPEGEFRNRAIRDVRIDLPLALEWRKRVAQGGDAGMTWDTRYYYEFAHGMAQLLMPPNRSHDPERNEWRRFMVEQASPRYFRIWRAESDTTPPLISQHGTSAAGWTSAYDPKGGVLFAYRNMAGRAPKALQVEAAGSGRAQVLLHPYTQPALHVRSAQGEALFNGAHAVDWIFFSGEHPEAAPDRYLAGVWGTEAPLHGTRASGPSELWDMGIEAPVAPLSADALSPYVRGGLPLPRGAMAESDGMRLVREGHALPLQARPLAYWPDGSVKWLLLIFPLQIADAPVAGEAADDETQVPFDVSLRDESRIPFELHYGPQTTAGVELPAVSAVMDDEQTVLVDTGLLRMELGTGEDWVRRLELNGRSLLGEPRTRPAGFLDFLRTDRPYRSVSSHAEGRLDPGPLHIERVEIEEAGPLRAVVRLEGESRGEEPCRIVLRLKFFADRAHVQIFHTVEFLHADPRDTFVQSMGLSLPLDLGGDVRLAAGGQDGPVSVAPSRNSGLHQLSSRHYRVLRAGEHGPEAVEEKSRSRGWLDASGASAGVTVFLRHMWREDPKALTYHAESGELTAWLWPESAPPMDVRRYSDYPHRAQGESVGGSNLWVRDAFYGQEPFVGIARTHEMALFFHDGRASASDIASWAEDVESPALIYGGYDRYRETGISLGLPDYERFPRAARNLDHFTDFWLYHQRLWNWYGFWDYGDIQHYFRGGYGDYVDPEELERLWNLPAEERPPRLGRDHWSRDYKPQQDWAFDNGRWGWTNTEGLPGHYLQLEYFRTGRRDVFFAAEAIGRHSRDVVTRHAGRWFGSGTRHGVQHWSCGGHQERQSVFSEYRFHYFMTGEGRSRDVMARLADTFYAVGWAPSARSLHHTRLYGLLTRWEMTGDERIGAMVRDYVNAMIVPEGIAATADIVFTEEGVEGSPRGSINSGNMMFHNFGALHALIEYYYITEDPALRRALVQMVESLVERDQIRFANHALALGFAARYAEDPAPIRAAIDREINHRGWRLLFQTVTANPAHWSGDTAPPMSVGGTFFFINGVPTLLGGLVEEPALEGGHLNSYRNWESEGRPNRKWRLRWQHEYDAEGLQGYVGPWRPVEVRDEAFPDPFARSADPALPGPANDWDFHRKASTLEGRFPGDDFEAMRVATLPAEGWRFRTDPERRGHRDGWYRPDLDDAEWEEIAIDRPWQEAGHVYVGNAWYRREVDVPDVAFDAVELHFEAVDESAWVWINGEYAGEHHIGPAGWDVPFALEVGELLRPGRLNHVAVLVMNTGAAGGIWRPVEWRFLRRAEDTE